MGILGAGGIAGHFASAANGFTDIDLVAIGSRSLEKARLFGGKHGLPKAYGSYRELVADPDIDAVYVALPNGLHREWAIACANAGKHVLCEKPMALTRSDGEEMFAEADRNGVVLIEGFPFRFQPQTQEVIRRVRAGQLGEIVSITACFGFRMRDPNNVRLDPSQGGGATWDVGVYPINLIRTLMGRSPASVLASSRLDDNGLDLTTTAILEFDNGAQASLWCSFESATFRRANIVGSEGAIDYAHNNHPLDEEAASFLLQTGHGHEMRTEKIVCLPGNGFAFEANAFSRLVLNPGEMEGTTREETLDGISIVEAILESVRSGKRVNVG